MIRPVRIEELERCVEVSQGSFRMVAKEYGFTEENTPLREWYERYGAEHIGTKKFDFFPFTCGYMKKEV